MAGNLAAVLGILLCIAAGGSRAMGSYHVLDFQAMTVFTAGIALMVLGCLGKLHRLEKNGPAH